MGVLLAAGGFFWFAKTVGWIPAVAGGSGIFWPVVVTVLGISIFLGSNRRMKDAE
jgi:hypothetical protein